jgi:hypothetical protein
MKVEQGVHLRVDNEDDAAAPSTITAVRPTEWFVFLAVHRRAAVTAVTGNGVNHHAVDEAGHRQNSFESNVMAEERSQVRRSATVASLSLRGRSNDVDGLAAALDTELHRTGRGGEQGVVTATTDIDAGVEVRAALADDDLAGLDDLTAESLDAQTLSVGFAAVS